MLFELVRLHVQVVVLENRVCHRQDRLKDRQQGQHENVGFIVLSGAHNEDQLQYALRDALEDLASASYPVEKRAECSKQATYCFE